MTTEQLEEIFNEDEMLMMLHTDVDKATDIVSIASDSMIKELEASVNDLMNLKIEEKNMYILLKCFEHVYDNYYVDAALIAMKEAGH